MKFVKDIELLHSLVLHASYTQSHNHDMLKSSQSLRPTLKSEKRVKKTLKLMVVAYCNGRLMAKH